MAVKLRLKRMGKLHRPFYRVCVIDSQRARGGTYIESIGHYDPFVADDREKVKIDKERAEYWLKVGAKPTETVASFLRAIQAEGLSRPKKPKKRRATREKTPGAKRPKPSKAVIEAAKKKAEKTRLRRSRRELQRKRAEAAKAAAAAKS
ncbi:MAG TPA: 30S ribosomal protein S16 [Planctomycetota bacterium]|nr:30S ribosomal protein S16 [Planctomycetota bacterium]